MSSNPFPVPRRYAGNGAKKALAVADNRLQRWLANSSENSGAIISGPTGCGKTISVAAFALRVESEHTPTWVKWIRADELSRLLSERGATDQIQALKQARLLVIDELGYERFPELVLEVLGARHDNDRPTVATSGLKLPEMAARYSDATIRRVVEVGNGCVVDCWKSIHRLETANVR